MYKIAAYITAYQDLEAVNNCISAIQKQSYPIQEIYIIDNSPNPLKLAEIAQNIIIDFHPENLGISGGLNIGLRWAIEKNYDFLWTFDQDSQANPDVLSQLIEVYKLLTENNKKIGIIAPLPVDKITGQKWHGLIFDKYRFREKYNWNQCDNYYECDAVITSGSLVSLAAAKNVSFPNELFFIDAVDWEYCLNFKQKNYQIIVAANIFLNHRFGESHQIKIFPFKRPITIYNYSPLRYYYICRNSTYLETSLARLNHKFLNSLIYRLRFLIILMAKIAIFEPNLTLQKIWACLTGTNDGLKRKLGKFGLYSKS